MLTPQFQQITGRTKAKYDSKCHGVRLSCDVVATRDRGNLVSLHNEQADSMLCCMGHRLVLVHKHVFLDF